MKVLSIRQPWATLIMAGQKDIENRTWRTHERGHIAIHACSNFNGLFNAERKKVVRLCKAQGFDDLALKLESLEHRDYPFGAILGTAELFDCVDFNDSPWFTGPFGFRLRDIRPLKRPMPIKGMLGLWTLPEEIEQDIAMQLGDHL